MYQIPVLTGSPPGKVVGIVTRDSILRVIQTRQMGIELVSFSEGLDFTTTVGKLLFQIISAFAEFERDCIRERVRAGMRNAKAKGKRIGRPPRTFLSEETRKAVALAYRQGEGSLRQLATRYGTSVGTVQRCVAEYQTTFAEVPVSA